MFNHTENRLLKAFFVILLMTAITSIAFVLSRWGIRSENILMLYVLGILLIIIVTRRYTWGIVSSLAAVLIFNFFFTNPYYSFKITDGNYLISIVIFICVSVIVTMLTTKLQKQMDMRVESEMKTEREQFRNHLLRSISHDLRTPLAGITGSASFLIESGEQIDRESRLELLNDILDDSVWLDNMVNNLLNMTRMQEGYLSIRNQEEVIEDIVSEAAARMKKRLSDRRFTIELEEELVVVPMDGQLIVQVLMNLLDNAVKHTEEGGQIVLKVDTIREPQRNQEPYVRFRVTDNGSGIDENVLESIFEDFVSAYAEIADSKRGIGLGLSIAKAIVEAHGGIIRGYNNQNKGATICFELPLKGR